MSEQPKKYNIDTLQKLMNVVTSENYERLMADFCLFMAHYIGTVDAIRKEKPDLCEGKLNCEIGEASFTWIDDGETKIKHFTVENKDTGEVTTIENQTP